MAIQYHYVYAARSVSEDDDTGAETFSQTWDGTFSLTHPITNDNYLEIADGIRKDCDPEFPTGVQILSITLIHKQVKGQRTRWLARNGSQPKKSN